MDIINENMPRTMNPIPKSLSKKKQEPPITSEILDQQTQIFLASGGNIEKVGSGTTPFNKRPSKERMQIINSGITLGNKARREEKIPIKR